MIFVGVSWCHAFDLVSSHLHSSRRFLNYWSDWVGRQTTIAKSWISLLPCHLLKQFKTSLAWVISRQKLVNVQILSLWLKARLLVAPKQEGRFRILDVARRRVVQRSVFCNDFHLLSRTITGNRCRFSGSQIRPLNRWIIKDGLAIRRWVAMVLQAFPTQGELGGTHGHLIFVLCS